MMIHNPSALFLFQNKWGESQDFPHHHSTTSPGPSEDKARAELNMARAHFRFYGPPLRVSYQLLGESV
jgi:hypothetical protein